MEALNKADTGHPGFEVPSGYLSSATMSTLWTVPSCVNTTQGTGLITDKGPACC